MISEMRTCDNCNGDKMIQVEYQDEGKMYYEDEIVSGIVKKCWFL